MTTGKFATKTTVSARVTVMEIQTVLEKYGAQAFGYVSEGGRAMLMFQMRGKRYRFIVPLPEKKDFRYTPVREFERSPKEQEDAYQQALRARWRALLLVIKAKLEAVEVGISTIEQEFLSAVIVPGSDNQTAGEWLIPQIEQAYRDGKLPPLLPAPSR